MIERIRLVPRELDWPEAEEGIERDVDLDIQKEEARVLEHIRITYGSGAPRGLRLAYHNEEHTRKVMRRALAILSAIDRSLRRAGSGPSPFVYRNVRLGCMYHDERMDNNIVELDGLRTRRFERGRNERASAEDLGAYIALLNERYGSGEAISAQDREECIQSVLVTEPTFSEGTVLQPKLAEGRSIAITVVALADLGSAGMEEPKDFLKECDALFFEMHPDFADMILRDSISETEEMSFRKAMSAPVASDTAYVRGRQAAFSTEIVGLPDVAYPALRAVFSRFDENIAAIPEEME